MTEEDKKEIKLPAGFNPVKMGSPEDSLQKIAIELLKIRVLLEGKAK